MKGKYITQAEVDEVNAFISSLTPEQVERDKITIETYHRNIEAYNRDIKECRLIRDELSRKVTHVDYAVNKFQSLKKIFFDKFYHKVVDIRNDHNHPKHLAYMKYANNYSDEDLLKYDSFNKKMDSSTSTNNFVSAVEKKDYTDYEKMMYYSKRKNDKKLKSTQIAYAIKQENILKKKLGL